MRGIWTDENKLRIWLQIELLAGEALAAEGVVPAEDFKRMKAGGEAWLADLKGLVERQKELRKTLDHDVIAFTTAIAEKINGPSSRWFHFGSPAVTLPTPRSPCNGSERGHPDPGCVGTANGGRAPREGASVHLSAEATGFMPNPPPSASSWR